MKDTILKYLKQIFTQRDNLTYSMSKLAAVSGIISLIFNFLYHSGTDYQSFGLGLSAIIAALAAKYHVEKE